MKASPRPPAVICGLLAVCLTALPAFGAVTSPQTIFFNSESDGTYTELDGTPFSVNAAQSLTGFSKFDQSLGTLTEVRFTIQIAASIGITVESDLVLDENLPFSLLLEDFDNFFTTDVVYSPTGGLFGRTVFGESTGFPPVGDIDQDPSAWIFMGEFFYISETVEIEYGGFAYGEQNLTSGSLFADDPDFNPVDFIGSGNVDSLSLFSYGAIEGVPYSDNIGNAFVDISVGISGGEATLQYVYIPVPEPSVLMLIGLGSIFAGRRRR